GRGYSSLLPIDSISISRISHPRDRFKTNCDIYVVVKGIDDFGRIILTHKELLGTWEQNATAFLAGETVSGIIRSIEEYGIFIELLPNLAGLAELVETAKIGQKSSVYIKSLIAQKMKIKLVCVDHFDDDKLTIKTCGLASGCFKYYLDGMKKSTNSLIIGHIDKWIYSPENCIKTIQTVF
ncbi:MAG: 30S ribosomal protein S1, partial [Oscillospiraceae bacterium]